jgi:DNA-binding NarL/FixJ family response regulator
METTFARQPDGAATASQSLPTAPAAGANPLSVFLVEDSAPIRERITEMLAAIDGVRMSGTADTAAAACSAILAERPHTVILDLRLAQGSGIDVLRRVHPLAPEIEFLVLTNFATPQYRDICLNSGASHFIDKSTEIGEVRRIVAERAASRAGGHLN